jgi:hypothetical protein
MDVSGLDIIHTQVSNRKITITAVTAGSGWFNKVKPLILFFVLS